MESLLFSGLFDLPWWGVVVVALALTHISIVGVTIFLHRHQAHRALDLHPVASAPQEARALQTIGPWLDLDDKMLHDLERTRLAEVLPRSRAAIPCIRCAAS